MSGKFGFVWSLRLQIHNHDSVGQSVGDEGGHRAARAAKNWKLKIKISNLKIENYGDHCRQHSLWSSCWWSMVIICKGNYDCKKDVKRWSRSENSFWSFVLPNCILVFFTFLNESKCFLPSLSDNFMKGSKECNLTAVNTQAIEAGWKGEFTKSGSWLPALYFTILT